MTTLTPEIIQSVVKKLEAAGTIYYQDWPFYNWFDNDGNELTEQQVEALCVAWLTEQVRAAAAHQTPAPTPGEPAADTPKPKKKRRRTQAELAAERALKAQQEAEASSTKSAPKRAGGRPKLAENKKLKCISTLVSPARYDELHHQAAELGMTVSLLVRPLVDPQSARNKRRLAGRQPGSGLSVADRQRQRHLASLATEVRQLAQRVETEAMPELAAELWELAGKLRVTLVF